MPKLQATRILPLCYSVNKYLAKKTSLKKSLIFILLCCATVSIFGQSASNDNKKDFWDRIYIGGDVSLNFGTITIIGATPIVGYNITDRWSAGIGATYLYFAQNIQGYGRYSTSIYGGNVFSRFLITDQIFAQSEYHVLNLEAYDLFLDDFARKNIPIWYVGGGYRAAVGSNSFIMIMVLLDLIDDINSPYSNPQIRGGISIGL
jgi:hypothetical protein